AKENLLNSYTFIDSIYISSYVECYTSLKMKAEIEEIIFLHQTSSSISSRNQVLSKQRFLTRYF
ncbi:hypothetical protein KJ032_26635, partial [Salmonella enterica subsp. enterica serovar Typhimurium]|nr:hypothetical protein [Salmonella enterica subsp. enterica serovar Typhimurium]